MLKVGSELPKFQGINQDGKIINSSDFLGKKLIIFFYPKANTPGCTAEACGLRDNYEILRKEGYQIIGVSADSVEKQKKFQSKFLFPFDVIADEKHQILELFGIWQHKKMMGKEYMGIVRTTFIFNEKGICQRVISKVNTKNHTEQILEKEN